MKWLLLTIALALTISIFIVGWTMEEPETDICDGCSHMLGLKFMPSCEPFGADATCGSDILLIAPLMFMWLFVIITFCGENK